MGKQERQLSEKAVEWLASLSRRRRTRLVEDLERDRDLALYQSIDLVAQRLLQYAVHPEDEDGWPQIEADSHVPPGAGELYVALRDADHVVSQMLTVLHDLGVDPPPEPPWWKRMLPWN